MRRRMDEVPNAPLIIPADCGRSALLHVDLLDRENGEGSALQHAMRVALNQREGTQLHHVTVEGLDEWIAWWDAQEASA